MCRDPKTDYSQYNAKYLCEFEISLQQRISVERIAIKNIDSLKIKTPLRAIR